MEDQLELAANREDYPCYDVQHYIDVFTKLVAQEERMLARFLNDTPAKVKQLQILAIEKANLKLAQEVANIPIPDVVRESDLLFKDITGIMGRDQPIPNYYHGMLEEEYMRSQRIFKAYKKSLLGLPKGDIKLIDNECFYVELRDNSEVLYKHFVSDTKEYLLDNHDNIILLKKLIRDKDSLLRDCRRLLKSIYLFERALKC